MNNKIKLTVLALCVLASFYFINKEYQSINFKFDFNIYSILVIFILHFFFLLSHAKRYLLVVNNITKKNISYWGWFYNFIISRMLNKIMPQAGNAYRAIQLKKDEGVDYKNFAYSYGFFTWFDTCFNLALAALALLFFSNQESSTLLLSFTLLFFFTLLTPKLIVLFNSLIASNNTFFNKIINHASNIFCKIQIDRKLIAKLLFLGLISFILMTTRLYYGFKIIGVDVSVVDIIIIHAVYKAALLIVILPGNLLIQEFVTGLVAELLNIGFLEGAMAALFLRICGYILLGLICIVSLVLTLNKKHVSSQ